jgi:hypothetical protein
MADDGCWGQFKCVVSFLNAKRAILMRGLFNRHSKSIEFRAMCSYMSEMMTAIVMIRNARNMQRDKRAAILYGVRSNFTPEY